MHAKELHTSWATVQLYFEVLAPNAARLFAAKVQMYEPNQYDVHVYMARERVLASLLAY